MTTQQLQQFVSTFSPDVDDAMLPILEQLHVDAEEDALYVQPMLHSLQQWWMTVLRQLQQRHMDEERATAYLTAAMSNGAMLLSKVREQNA